MNRAEAAAKYEGFTASELRVCPSCFLVDYHDQWSNAGEYNALREGGNVCPECQHADDHPFPKLNSPEAREIIFDFIGFVIRGIGVEDRHRRYAYAALEILSDEGR